MGNTAAGPAHCVLESETRVLESMDDTRLASETSRRLIPFMA